MGFYAHAINIRLPSVTIYSLILASFAFSGLFTLLSEEAAGALVKPKTAGRVSYVRSIAKKWLLKYDSFPCKPYAEALNVTVNYCCPR